MYRPPPLRCGSGFGCNVYIRIGLGAQALKETLLLLGSGVLHEDVNKVVVELQGGVAVAHGIEQRAVEGGDIKEDSEGLVKLGNDGQIGLTGSGNLSDGLCVSKRS